MQTCMLKRNEYSLYCQGIQIFIILLFTLSQVNSPMIALRSKKEKLGFTLYGRFGERIYRVRFICKNDVPI